MQIQRIEQNYTNPSMKNRVDIAADVKVLFDKTGKSLLEGIIRGLARGQTKNEQKVNIRIVRNVNGNMPDIIAGSVTPESKNNGPLRDTWIRTMKPDDIESFNVSVGDDFSVFDLTGLARQAVDAFRKSHPLKSAPIKGDKTPIDWHIGGHTENINGDSGSNLSQTI